MTLWSNINIIAETIEQSIEQVYCSMGDVGVLNDAAFRFSPHDAMYSADYAVAIYICVWPPDTLRYCAKTVKHNSEKPLDPTC